MPHILFPPVKKLFRDAGKQAFSDEAINKKYLMKEYLNGCQLPEV